MFTKLMLRETLDVKLPGDRGEDDIRVALHAQGHAGSTTSRIVIEVPDGYHLEQKDVDGALIVSVVKTEPVPELVDGRPSQAEADLPYYEVEFVTFAGNWMVTFREGGRADFGNSYPLGRFSGLEQARETIRKHAAKWGMSPVYVHDISRRPK